MNQFVDTYLERLNEGKKNIIFKCIYLSIYINIDKIKASKEERYSAEISLYDLVYPCNDVDQYDRNIATVAKTISEYIYILSESNIYSDIYKYYIKVDNSTIYPMINFAGVECVCKTCGKDVFINNLEDLGKYSDRRVLANSYFCCYRNLNCSTNKSGYFENIVLPRFNKYSINRNKFKLKSKYLVQCNHHHTTAIYRKYKEFDNGVTINNMDKEMKCWICEDKVEEKYELFKLLKELNTNYYIKETMNQLHYYVSSSKEFKFIKRLIIYTYNNKGHLTGKIVFSDLFGEEQAKANSNNLVFRWFELKYINNRQYCLEFLNEFFKDIVNKNGLKESK